MKLHFHCTIVFLALLLLIGCTEDESTSPKAPNVLKGTWLNGPDGQETVTLTFYEDLTGLYAFGNSSPIAFTYVYTATSVTIAGAGITGSYSYELLAENELRLFDQVFLRQ